MGKKLLEVKNLNVTFNTSYGKLRAVKNVSFDLEKGKLAIVGESGSGKSQVSRAILRLTAANGYVSADKLDFDGIDLINANERQLQKIRGNRISMIMQDPKYSLNPTVKVGKQIEEAYFLHNKVSKGELKQRCINMLKAVQITAPDRVYNSYPHELSGGMGQRIMIAMMVMTDPEIMIADEPTSALDVTVQGEILNIMNKLVSENSMGLIFISHDLHLVSKFCDKVLVMYKGEIVEAIDAKNLQNAKHPYTRGLYNCVPRLGDKPKKYLTTLDRQFLGE